MYTLISFAGAVLVEGLVLSRTANRMRILVSGMKDTLELKRTGENWFTEKGEGVEFCFLASASKLVRDVHTQAAGKGIAGCAVI